MSHEREDSIRLLIARGIAAADSTSDQFLDWLHPEMKHYFRDFFLRGQRLYLQGMSDTGSLPQQIEANRLIAQWYSQFWDAHKTAITDKALAP
jgi:hypothetical protein